MPAERFARGISLFMMLFTIGLGLVTTCKEVRPFWIDEWRVIYNLKFRPVAQLWGTLDYMQQFPRAYLTLVKCFVRAFDYNYFSLRAPSFIVGTLVILYAWRLMIRIYPEKKSERYLFVLFLLASAAFSAYFVQIKQYTMDMLASLLAIGQFITLFEIGNGRRLPGRRYTVFCLGCLVLPFFSYTYPIAIAPGFLFLSAQAIQQVRNRKRQLHWKATLIRQTLPLLCIMCSIAGFYYADVRQLLADEGMRRFWARLLLIEGYNFQSLIVAADLFRIVHHPSHFDYFLSGTGILAFLLWPFGRSLSEIASSRVTIRNAIECYSFILICMVLVLFLLRRIPLGEARLHAFTIPAISILTISFVREAAGRIGRRLAAGMTILLLTSVTAMGVWSQLSPYTEKDYPRLLEIYRNTGNALRVAEARNYGILITPGVAYPYENTFNYPEYELMPGDWVVKTHPAYHVATSLPVWKIETLAQADSLFAVLLPPRSVIAGDGLRYKVIARGN